jgi:hypothetical protein
MFLKRLRVAECIQESPQVPDPSCKVSVPTSPTKKSPFECGVSDAAEPLTAPAGGLVVAARTAKITQA